MSIIAEANRPGMNYADVQEIHLPHVDPRIRIFRYEHLVDTWAVISDRYVTVVDTMCHPRAMHQIMDMLADTLTPNDRRSLLVINTHADWDHVWGNSLFAGPDPDYPAPILAHRVAAERLRSWEAEVVRRQLQAENPGEFDDVINVPPTVLFDDELQIDGGDLGIQVLATPGHQPDHVAVWLPEIGTLLAADAAEMPVPGVEHPQSLPLVRDSLQRMYDLHPGTVLYCHVPDHTDVSVIEHNMLYYNELEQRCRAAIARHDLRNLIEMQDLADAIRWPLQDTLPWSMMSNDPPSAAFHQHSIRLMLQWLDTKS